MLIRLNDLQEQIVEHCNEEGVFEYFRQLEEKDSELCEKAEIEAK